MKKGNLFVYSGPSGVGKGTILDKIMDEDSNLYRSVSATTRSPRSGEINGVHYYFMTEEEFLDSVEKNEFLEYVKTYNTYYGTLKKDVEDKLSEGKDVFLEINILSIGDSGIILIFFLLPSILYTLLFNVISPSPSKITISIIILESYAIFNSKFSGYGNDNSGVSTTAVTIDDLRKESIK